MTQAEQYFTREVRVGTERLKREIGYNPTYFNRMVAEHGAVEASRRLIESRTVSDGFTKLWEHGRLAMSIEALAVLPWCAELFADDVVAKARRRLEDHRFDVDGHIRAVPPPPWWR